MATLSTAVATGRLSASRPLPRGLSRKSPAVAPSAVRPGPCSWS